MNACSPDTSSEDRMRLGVRPKRSWRPRAVRGVAAIALLLIVACSRPEAQDPQAEWPVEIDENGTQVVLYQPEPDSLKDDALTARAAVSVRRPQDKDPIFGAVSLEARVATDRDARTVTLLETKVSQVSFPGSAADEAGQLETIVQAEVPKLQHTFSLDRLEATLDEAAGPARSTEGFQNAPPHIVFAKTPTVLVTLDGPPQLQHLAGSELMRVVNTPFVMLFDSAHGTYWLRESAGWASAPAIEGPWQNQPQPPAAVVSALPSQPAPDGGPPDPRAGATVLVVTEPTELIVSDGEPTWTPLVGSELLYLANSDSDVFLLARDKQYFVLLSGRWYRSESLEQGPWSFVAADALPPAFAQIPAGSPRDSVRAFVAGTDEARDAVLDASVPQTSAIARNDTSCQVSYDGEPKFLPIAGTRLAYAVNTPDAVLQLDAAYYCCQAGVWYTSGSPQGPWTVCASVPAELYAIPPSCPLYPVTYVHVYGATPDVVYEGYLPGYTGCYVCGPTIVYGTGCWYHGWFGAEYYPYPWTFGFEAHYDPWGCGWWFGPSWGWGWSAGWFAASWGWGWPGWWGPCDFDCDHFAIHHHTVTVHALPPRTVTELHVRTVPAHAGRLNLYQRPEHSARNATTARVVKPAAQWKPSQQPNDVFVDRHGAVVRRTEQGWEQRDREGWRPAPHAPPPPAPPPGARSAPPGDAHGAPPSSRPPMPAPVPAPPHAEHPTAPPPEAQRPEPPRDDLERMSHSREQGNSRASDFRKRSGPGGPRGD